jgi:hypothetical protein
MVRKWHSSTFKSKQQYLVGTKVMISSVITRKPLELGFLYVSKKDAHLFPSTDAPVKIAALLDENGRKVEITYNPRYRRIHGLLGFYREHNAQIGDLVEIEALFKKYRFRFRKSSVPTELAKTTIKKLGPYPLVGQPLNFRGLTYAPINENGVIFLFSKVAEDLGITIEGIQVKFPDAFGKQYERGKGYPVTIEFEYRSSDYERHGHPREGCDIIVCWEHDWNECSIQVIELRSLLKELGYK